MKVNRIPNFANKTQGGMKRWFTEMAIRGLIFHPEEKPSDIVSATTGRPFFNSPECSKLDAIMAEMRERFGEEMIETVYPIFMKAAGFPVPRY